MHNNSNDDNERGEGASSIKLFNRKQDKDNEERMDTYMVERNFSQWVSNNNNNNIWLLLSSYIHIYFKN